MGARGGLAAIAPHKALGRLILPFLPDGAAFSSHYFQDAAIRAAFEKILASEASGEAPRVLLSLATGSGKTVIAANLLWLSAGVLTRAGHAARPGHIERARVRRAQDVDPAMILAHLGDASHPVAALRDGIRIAERPGHRGRGFRGSRPPRLDVQGVRADEEAVDAPFLEQPIVRWLLPERREEGVAGTPHRDTHLWPLWIFLRALGVIFLSAFVSLAGQIRGLIGPHGILPAREYLEAIGQSSHGLARWWGTPTLLWISSSDAMLQAIVIAGCVASAALIANVAPRVAVACCGVLFLSFVAAAQDFAGYQSDGMLLQAALAAFLVAPRGLRPGLGERDPPTPLSLFLLRLEWFAIYFESGVVKLASGDPQWASLTAMDHYYENGPLPTWIGWWVQHLPHGFHAATALFTLVVELVVVWFAWFPRPFKLATIAIVTPMQLSIIATANYTFLNWLVLFLGVTFLDDRLFARFGWGTKEIDSTPPRRWRTVVATFVEVWIVWSCLALFLFGGRGPLSWPARAIADFRVANRYGLFAVMTTGRWEIEFQATLDPNARPDAPADDRAWVAYPFRWKPQDPNVAPKIFAPYQPRFDWNLWFASLGSWDETPWVLRVEELLMDREPTVLALFAIDTSRPDRPGDPLHGAAPAKVRAVLWRYRFTSVAQERATGAYWTREDLGLYAPALGRASDGRKTLELDDGS